MCKFVSESEEKGGGDGASLPEKLSVFIKFFLSVWRLETNRVQFRNIKIIETKKTT